MEDLQQDGKEDLTSPDEGRQDAYDGFSPFFHRLTETEDPFSQTTSPSDLRKQLRGAIAYALYKSLKCRWIEREKQKRGGDRPSSEEVAKYVEALNDPEMVDSWLTKADSLLFQFSHDRAREEFEEYRENALSSVLSEKLAPAVHDICSHVTKRTKTGRTVMINIWSAIVFGVLVASLAWIVYAENSPYNRQSAAPPERAETG